MSELRTSQKIVDVATDLIKVRGYNAFSYQDISSLVGIRKASVHHHFSTKGDLGSAVVRRVTETLRETLAEIEAESSDEVKEAEKPELKDEPIQPTLTHEPEISETAPPEPPEDEVPAAKQKETAEEIREPEQEPAEITPEEETESIKKTVGENFIKGKSLNDLMLENKTLDKKLASSPITKLETAIGLNDRFQYTRELFDNKPELFRETVQEIDQANTLDEAVAYLNSNFKWKKTDTSIQFAQLVKRRFTK